MATARPRVRRVPKRRSAGWPTTLVVRGLFGENEPERRVEFRQDDRVTILTGPNGSGKTRLLSILRAVLASDWADVAREPFAEVVITFSSRRIFRVVRTADVGHIVLDLEVLDRQDSPARCTIRLSVDPAAHLMLPTWIRRFTEDLWEDTRDGELLELDELKMRFPRAASQAEAAPEYQVLEEDPANGLRRVQEILGAVPTPTFVRTQRLDVEQVRRPGHQRGSSRRRSRIHEYVNQIQSQVEVARAEYSRISQLADSQFAARALDKTSGSPRTVAELREQFDQLVKLHDELWSTGLVAETPGIAIGGRSITQAERRFLSVFLDDWQRKLQPLLPVHEKLQMLQDIVGRKLSRKQLGLDEQGRLTIKSSYGEPIPEDQLSSGEQHLLALFAMLLFNPRRASLILIDEPEISLHAEWKHAFLDDIRRVADAVGLHTVIATHSSAIINGQWDLVEVL